MSQDTTQLLDQIDIIKVAKQLPCKVTSRGTKTFIYCPNPQCDENRDKKPHHCRLGGEKPHLYGCHKCKVGGNAWHLVRAVMGCSGAEAFRWLRQHGFLPDDEKATQQETVSPLQQLAVIRGWSVDALKALGAEAKGRKVRIPMKDAEGKTTGHIERMADNTEVPLKDGGSTKSKSLGKHGLIYPERKLSDLKPILLTEGEADVCAVISAGYRNVIGTKGANPGRDSHDYLQTMIPSGASVILTPDPDGPGRRWRDSIGRTLSNASIEVRFIPPDDSDIDDRLRYKDEDVHGLIHTAKAWTPPENKFFEGKTFFPLRLARRLGETEQLHYGYDPETGEGRLMRWTGQAWIPAVNVDRKAQHLLGEKTRDFRVKQAISALERDVPCTPWEQWDNIPENFIACQNGLVNLENLHVHDHDPKFLYRSVIPWSFDANAHDENLWQALTDFFPTQKVRQTALQIVGYTLVAHTRAKIIIYLLGETDSGKTTFLEWVRALVGSDNYSTKTPSALTENRFAAAALEGKLLNAPDELDRLDLSTVERLKALSGGGTTFEVEHKKRDSYQAPMTATLIFACNKLPTLRGKADKAYYNRLVILPFTNSFPDGDSALRDKWPADPTYMRPLLRYAVEGLRSLRENDWTVEKPPAIRQVCTKYKTGNDPLDSFIELRCVVKPEVKVRRSRFYDEFKTYCRRADYPVQSKQKTYARLRDEWNIEEPKSDGIFHLQGIALETAKN
ncbi:MAG: phage/plasmid primase, P4 family, partial [Planctomycetota bacterium]